MAIEKANRSGGDEDTGLFHAIRILASNLVLRNRVATSGGKTYGGDRDIEEQLGYLEVIDAEDYRHRYERGDIAERIVEAFPKATWRGGAQIVEDPDPGKTTPFERDFVSLDDRLGIWRRFQRADILAGLGHYAVMMIGAPGNLDEELPDLNGPDDVLYLAPYAEEHADVMEVETDTASKRFGLPTKYRIEPRSDDARFFGNQKAREVHWTRIIHVAEGLLDDDIFGKPRLRSSWNRLDDKDKIVGSGAEAAWRRQEPGMQLDLAKDLEIDQTEETRLKEQIEEYLHGMTRVMRTRGVDVNLLESSVHGFGNNLKALLELIAGTAEIPLRKLIGSERGELASTMDRTAFNDAVSDRRSEFAEPEVRELVDRLVEHGGLAPHGEEGYVVVWPDQDDLTESEKAEVASSLASANKAHFDAGLDPIQTSNEMRDRLFHLAPIEKIEAAADPGVEDVTDEEEEQDVEDAEGADEGEEEVEADEGAEEETGPATAALREAKLKVARSLGLLRPRAAAETVDVLPGEDEFGDVNEAADAHRDRIARLANRMLTAASENVDEEALEEALSERNIVEVERILAGAVAQAGAEAEEGLAQVLLDTLIAGARETDKTAKARGSFLLEPEETM